jgi:hypothetical protein
MSLPGGAISIRAHWLESCDLKGMIDVLKLLIGFIAGLFVGFLLGLVLPIEFFYIACIILALLAVLFFFFFHFGLRDFQEY